MNSAPTPVICIIGLSGCGKTTLTAQLIEILAIRGLKIGALKHASHGFQMDKHGKDSERFRRAGAYAIGVASERERAVITSTRVPTTLAQLVDALPPGLDLVLCEGFASEPGMKIGVHCESAPLPPGLEGLIALVGAGSPYRSLPTFEVSEVEAIAQFILSACSTQAGCEASCETEPSALTSPVPPSRFHSEARPATPCDQVQEE